MSTMRLISWAFDLRGISPVAKLLAISMAGTAVPTGPAQSDRPAGERDIDYLLNWIGCEESELRAACTELLAHDVEMTINDRALSFSLPCAPDDNSASIPKTDPLMSIYVISSSDGATKIGISNNPKSRLAGLQAAVPIQKLKLEWSASGPASIIRLVERRAHDALSDRVLAGEWFRVEVQEAIGVASRLLREAGIST